MVQGCFREGSPYVRGTVELPGIGVGHEVAFLVDTGADATCIMPQDSLLLGVDYNQLAGESVPIWGVSGSTNSVRHRANIVFLEDDGTHRLYDIDVLGMTNLPDLDGLPSVLGQDVLSQ